MYHNQTGNYANDTKNRYQNTPQPHYANQPQNNYPGAPQTGYPNTQKPSPANPIQDYGPTPFVVDMDKTAEHNHAFRTALWTGDHLQLTVMNIPVGQDVGLEVHPDIDQVLCILDGNGLVQMGDQKENLYFMQPAYNGYAIFVPAGTWHNVTNTGNKSLKLYTIYSPPEHPWGTVQQTQAEAEAAENNRY